MVADSGTGYIRRDDQTNETCHKMLSIISRSIQRMPPW